MIDRPINSELFASYVEQLLGLTLAVSDIVILDNLGSHEGHCARRAIRDAGAHLMFLPAYSPDLKPIEQLLFAKLKHLMRAALPRTVEETWRKLGALLETVSPSECRNYFTESGCDSSKNKHDIIHIH